MFGHFKTFLGWGVGGGGGGGGVEGRILGFGLFFVLHKTYFEETPLTSDNCNETLPED